MNPQDLPDDYTIEIVHYRHIYMFGLMSGEEWRNGNYRPTPRGGKTIATILNASGECIATGVAHCGRRDQFSYKIGREIATGRAMFAAGLRARKRNVGVPDKFIPSVAHGLC